MASARSLLALLLVAAASTGAMGNGLRVSVESGVVEGFSMWGVDQWRGVPYAQAPVGPLRFRPPQTPPPRWEGVRWSWLAAPICPQEHTDLLGWLGSEDCLYINVAAPSFRNLSEPLAVMVWIYGGSFQFGDGIEFGLYDPTQLVSKHNVVVVSFNYRLGPLGWLATPGLKKENANGEAGNQGFYDQQAALRWVQNNIAAFGGDKDRVTIFGESAGAFAICAHIVSPGSRGLFHHAIIESGSCSLELFFKPEDRSMAWSKHYAQLVGCDSDALSDEQTVECLRAKDLNGVMGQPWKYNFTTKGYQPLMFPYMPWSLTMDGHALTASPQTLMEAGQANDVSVLAGTNTDEGSLFIQELRNIIPALHNPLVDVVDFDLIVDHFFGSNATVRALVNGAYPLSNYPNATVQSSMMIRDYFFLCPTSRANLALAALGRNTFLYQNRFLDLTYCTNPTAGVYHSAELQYVWGNAWPPVLHRFSSREKAMSDVFGTYWSNFAKFGTPNAPADTPAHLGAPPVPPLPVWPQYTRDGLDHLVLDSQPLLGARLEEPLCEVWDQIAQWSPPVQTQQTLRKEPQPQAVCEAAADCARDEL